MGQTVTIKGTKSGIILVLDPSVSFEELSLSIASKFRSAASFLGSHNMGLIVRGRILDDYEFNEVIRIIEENSNLKITCVIDEASELDKVFRNAMNSKTKAATEEKDDPGDEYMEEETEELPDDLEENAIIYRGNLRSGQTITSKKSIIILGDVKPGGNVTSYGSIFILGDLRGNAYAGAGGDKRAIIVAHKLDPIQVRIARSIAISPDAEKGVKIRVKKKKFMQNTDNEPEVLYIENGHIVKTSYGSSFLRQFYRI
ncbi:MAG: septum site-determining protein MinC [Butyrivibrio sp.]|nr:septum site-determining protein MinC [Butyrivibrio sp.]